MKFWTSADLEQSNPLFSSHKTLTYDDVHHQTEFACQKNQQFSKYGQKSNILTVFSLHCDFGNSKPSLWLWQQQAFTVTLATASLHCDFGNSKPSLWLWQQQAFTVTLATANQSFCTTLWLLSSGATVPSLVTKGSTFPKISRQSWSQHTLLNLTAEGKIRPDVPVSLKPFTQISKYPTNAAGCFNQWGEVKAMEKQTQMLQTIPGVRGLPRGTHWLS